MKKQYKEVLLLIQTLLTLFTLFFMVFTIIDKTFLIALQIIIAILLFVIAINSYYIFNRKKMSYLYFIATIIMIVMIVYGAI
ncbi:MAG: hypothetical protein PHE54_04410 [Bacilli bacterium]|nr:hypothetical protein [Bacilli bacterium]